MPAMTSDVMATARARTIVERMTKKILLLSIALVVFTGWSVTIIADRGYLGFLTVARQEPWAAQMLVDVTIALTLFANWLVPDARRRGITPWPYVVAIVGLGSIGALAYLLHREIKAVRATATARA